MRHLLPVAYTIDVVGVLVAASPGPEVLVCGLVVGGEVCVQPAQAAHKPAPCLPASRRQQQCSDGVDHRTGMNAMETFQWTGLQSSQLSNPPQKAEHMHVAAPVPLLSG